MRRCLRLIALVTAFALVSASYAETPTRQSTGGEMRSLTGLQPTLADLVREALDQPDIVRFSRIQDFAQNLTITAMDRNLAWFALGYLRLKAGQPREAIDAFNSARGPLLIEDYLTFNLGVAYFQAGYPQEAIKVLQGFSTRHSDSLLKQDAAIAMANALIAAGQPSEAINILERMRGSTADVALSLARAWIKSGDIARGAIIFQNIVYSKPLSWQANVAKRELSANPQWNVPPPSVALRESRANALFNAKRWNDAAEEFAALLKATSTPHTPEVRVRMALALRRAGKTAEARQQLALVKPTTAAYEPERLLAVAEIARASADEKQLRSVLARLRVVAPRDAALEQSLLSAANYYLLRSEWSKSTEYFRELERRFPHGKDASYACWKAAWLDYRQGNLANAKRAFDSYIAKYHKSREMSAALYWRARIAEREKDTEKSEWLYQRLVRHYPNSFYGYRASLRLGSSLLSPVAATPQPTTVRTPIQSKHANNSHLARSFALERSGLADLAVNELRAANLSSAEFTTEASRVYRDARQYHRAIQITRSEFPDYLAASHTIPELGWKNLFPIPDWPELADGAAQHQLDVELILALIRQESEFNPRAVSSANAVGLMQLLPTTATAVNKSVGLGPIQPDDLKRPETNLRVGIYHFRQLIDEFKGQKEYALAAYNAGSSRVRQWLAAGPYEDTEEFVESIPFTETREYVQAIIRNESLYRRLYSTAHTGNNAS